MRIKIFSLIFILTLLFVDMPTTAHAAGGGSGKPLSCKSFNFTVSNNTYYPLNGTDLQTALNCVRLGGTIVLQTATPYTGSFELPNKTTGRGWITLISASAAVLPAVQRVSPVDMPNLAQLQVPSGGTSPVVYTAAGAHHYSFVGIAFSTPQWVDTLLKIGTGDETSTSQLPHHFTFNRCIFAGSARTGTKHGLVANAGQGPTFCDDLITIENSYFQDFKDPSNDAQAIAVWNGWGPFLIQNNYLEASGENVMFGGADPSISKLVPSNIQIVQNHFYKPLSWLAQSWRIKNLFELKNAQNVTINGNVFQNNWIQADQLGWAIVFTPRNQDGRANWSTVQDVTFENNLVANSINGFDILGTDETHPSGPLKNLTIQNNLLLNINPNWAQNINSPYSLPVYSHSAYPEPGQILYLINATSTSSNGPQNVTFTHNTSFQSGAEIFSNGPATSGLVFTENVLRHNVCVPGGDNNCGIAGGQLSPGQITNPTAPGLATLGYYFTSPYNVSNNVLFDGGNPNPWTYPSPNETPSTVSFVDANVDPLTGLTTSATPEYDLSSTDPSYTISTPDGAAPGVSWSLLNSYIQGVVQVYSK
jgi:hypothetical protein